MSSEQTITGFLDELAAKQPTPGGGSAAALTGATAAATASMVVSYSLGKKKLAEHEEPNQAASKQLANARAMFMQLAAEDAEGYGVLNALWSLDKDDPKRVKEWDAAVAGAIAPPRAMLALAVDLLIRIDALVATTNRMLKSDLGVAAVLAEAAARSAAWNIRINLSLVDDATSKRISDEIDAELASASELCAAIEKGCA